MPHRTLAAALLVAARFAAAQRELPSFGPNYNENYTVYGTALRQTLIGDGSGYDKIMPPRSHVRHLPRA